jgi:nitroreductase
MSNSRVHEVSAVIKGRRSVSWAKMNGALIPDVSIHELLQLAHWAPTHARTEPWQFFVYTGTALTTFGKAHADLYWQHTPEEKRLEATFNKLLHNVDKTSHLIIAAMKRGSNPKIPAIEEIAAASSAIQNILLGATAMGISSFWSTGGMTHHPALRQHLSLGDEDIVLGLLYLGYTDEPEKEGVRNAPVSEKAIWL